MKTACSQSCNQQGAAFSGAAQPGSARDVALPPPGRGGGRGGATGFSLPAGLPGRDPPPPPQLPQARCPPRHCRRLPRAAGPLGGEPRPPGAAGQAADAGWVAGKEAAFPDGPFRQQREGQRLPQPGRASPQSRGRASLRRGQDFPAPSPASPSEIKCVPKSDAPLAASLVPPRRACFPGAAAWRGFETPRSLPGGAACARSGFGSLGQFCARGRGTRGVLKISAEPLNAVGTGRMPPADASSLCF
ncbi:basic proline-rich protein-like [Cygnus olor]|uniref:basic proline-rich protein-like n=1 Tax=Cygnus olor TaxID=8869 RepID=UPI001ADE6C68|nr:basic proline-rich protein-like [Cygnus olor]